MYDIFFQGADDTLWNNIKILYPAAQRINNGLSLAEIQKKSFTGMFWIVWDDLILTDFNLNEYKVTQWDNNYTHVFKNGEYYDGICLVNKKSKILGKEFDHRFFINKKEIDIVASNPKPYDIVFISYHETFAEQNFNNLKKRIKTNKLHWIKNIKGIHQAHIEAAKLVTTDMFYVVDADAIVNDTFSFNYHIPYYDFNAKSTVHVWKSQNPINGLEYGNGGIKLLPRQLTINMDLSKPDMTTSISKWFKPMPEVSNVNGFNTDPFNTWKSAFRECCKLASRVIDRQNDEETQIRLDRWCTIGNDLNAIKGAIAGRKYGEDNRTNTNALIKINDFDWLREQFDAR
jgi:hypothetical protein